MQEVNGPEVVLALQADNGKYLSRFARSGIEAIEAAKNYIDKYCQFVVTKLSNGKLTLKADNGKYLSRINRGGIDPIEAVKETIDIYCQFDITILPDQKIALKADNGKYLSRFTRSGIDAIEAAKENMDQYCMFVLTEFSTGKVALQADSSKYLSRISRSGKEPIEAAKDNIDQYSQFVITQLPNGKIALQADNGKYLSRINRSGVDGIEAAKDSIDRYCQFFVKELPNGKVTLKADNEKYLSRYTRDNVEAIEAVKDTADTYCQFNLTYLEIATFLADNGKYLSRFHRSGVDGIEAVKDSIDPYCRFIVWNLLNGRVALQADNGKYLSRFTRSGVEGIEAAKTAIDQYCQFIVSPLSNGKVALQADTSKYLSRITRPGPREAIEAAKDTMDIYCQFGMEILGEIDYHGMIRRVSPSSHPVIPSGSTLDCRCNPDLPNQCTSFPIISCCRYTYWAYNYFDGREAMNIVAYDPNGATVKQWNKSDAKSLWDITSSADSRIITFIGEKRKSFEMSWDELGLMKYKATVDDISEVAKFYNLNISQQDAEKLAAALPEFNCHNCCGMDNLPQHVRVKRSLWTIGAVIGGIIGGAIGGIIGGPAGAAVGAAVGANFGAGIGVIVEPTPTPAPINPDAQEVKTYVYKDKYPVGPFQNSSVSEDIFDWHFPRYGDLDSAGALARPKSGGKAQAWYPVQKEFLDPIVKFNPRPHPQGNIYKYIFVVIQVPNVAQSGKPAYQMRIHSEDFYPDTIPANKRINHSQLSEGGRFAALLRYESMLVYGAGTIYIQNALIMGMDSRTGHYYYSFKGKDHEILDAAISLVSDLGYDTSIIKRYEVLINYLNNYY